MRDARTDHVPSLHGGKLVAVGPVLGLVLDVEIEFADLERFEGHCAVAIELHLDPVEVVLAAVDRQIGAPPVADALEHHLPARLHPADPVRAAAQGRFEGGGLEVPVLPVVLRQHGQFAEAQDQQRIVGRLEYEANAVAVEDIDAAHPLQARPVAWMTVLEQQTIGEGDIVGGNRLAIVKTGRIAQVEDDPAAIVRVLDRFGDQSVGRGRFVTGRIVDAGTHHQRLVEFADAVLEEARRGAGARAFEGIGVECVEGARSHQAYDAAFWRIGIHPVEMGEILWILEDAELRVAVTFADSGKRGGAQGQADQR